jgi:hypothetical protein
VTPVKSGAPGVQPRPPRVTPEEHAAFKVEMQNLRQVVRKIRHERLKYVARYNALPTLPLVQEWRAKNKAALDRLWHWDKVLHEEQTRLIRSPVRLWDSMNKLRDLAS